MNANIQTLLSALLGTHKTQNLSALMKIPQRFNEWEDELVSRAELAQALNMALFSGILDRVPSGMAYTSEVAARGAKVMLDHGALRTVRWFDLGQLPPGEAAITRVLRPLGFRLNGVFPLARLKMTGRSYAHLDDAENISQFFVSELHPERFSEDFQAAVSRVLGNSIDPLTPAAVCLLNELERDAYLSMAQAKILLPILVSCFERQHAIPSLLDYEILRADSAEMAWIATEGNVFNHATDRVADVFVLAEQQRALGRAMKANVEVSSSGRIKQTALKADPVTRQFVGAGGELIEREVPGSFYEFITRDFMNEGECKKLDLGFDASNAQGIFKMTVNAN